MTPNIYESPSENLNIQLQKQGFCRRKWGESGGESAALGRQSVSLNRLLLAIKKRRLQKA